MLLVKKCSDRYGYTRKISKRERAKAEYRKKTKVLIFNKKRKKEERGGNEKENKSRRYKELNI